MKEEGAQRTGTREPPVLETMQLNWEQVSAWENHPHSGVLDDGNSLRLTLAAYVWFSRSRMVLRAALESWGLVEESCDRERWARGAAGKGSGR